MDTQSGLVFTLLFFVGIIASNSNVVGLICVGSCEKTDYVTYRSCKGCDFYIICDGGKGNHQQCTGNNSDPRECIDFVKNCSRNCTNTCQQKRPEKIHTCKSTSCNQYDWCTATLVGLGYKFVPNLNHCSGDNTVFDATTGNCNYTSSTCLVATETTTTKSTTTKATTTGATTEAATTGATTSASKPTTTQAATTTEATTTKATTTSASEPTTTQAATTTEATTTKATTTSASKPTTTQAATTTETTTTEATTTSASEPTATQEEITTEATTTEETSTTTPSLNCTKLDCGDGNTCTKDSKDSAGNETCTCKDKSLFNGTTCVNAVIFEMSVRFENWPWNDEYNDITSDPAKDLNTTLGSMFQTVFENRGLLKVDLTKIRKGSVITTTDLHFAPNQKISQQDIVNTIKQKSGDLGIDPDSIQVEIKINITVEAASSNNWMIALVLAAALLMVTCIASVTLFLYCRGARNGRAASNNSYMSVLTDGMRRRLNLIGLGLGHRPSRRQLFVRDDPPPYPGPPVDGQWQQPVNQGGWPRVQGYGDTIHPPARGGHQEFGQVFPRFNPGQDPRNNSDRPSSTNYEDNIELFEIAQQQAHPPPPGVLQQNMTDIDRVGNWDIPIGGPGHLASIPTTSSGSYVEPANWEHTWSPAIPGPAGNRNFIPASIVTYGYRGFNEEEAGWPGHAEQGGRPRQEQVGRPRPEQVGRPRQEQVGRPRPELGGRPRLEQGGRVRPELGGRVRPELGGRPRPEQGWRPRPEQGGRLRPQQNRPYRYGDERRRHDDLDINMPPLPWNENNFTSRHPMPPSTPANPPPGTAAPQRPGAGLPRYPWRPESDRHRLAYIAPPVTASRYNRLRRHKIREIQQRRLPAAPLGRRPRADYERYDSRVWDRPSPPVHGIGQPIGEFSLSRFFQPYRR